ncbi:hypothetical protein KG212_003667 [Acinetobacter baumannii]
MDKCREEFEKQKYWIGLFRDAVDFDEELGRYVLNGQRKLYAFHLDSFNEKWAIWQEAWQHQQAKVEELEGKLKQAYEDVDTFAEAHKRECGFKAQLAKDRAELQKRVDAALAVLTEYYTGSYDESPDLVVDLEQALKGGA